MVTAIGNMEMQAYRELHCYQYIMKPFHREQVEEVVQKVLEKESREKSPVIVVKKDGINYQLKCEDIRYLEAIPRGTRLHPVSYTHLGRGEKDPGTAYVVSDDD